MLNSTMQSRKQEILLETKEALMEYLLQKELLRKTCEEKIEELENRHFKWFGYYALIGFGLLGGVSAFAFIAYGYSEEMFVIFRNLIGILIAGVVAYGIVILEQEKDKRKSLENWKDIMEITQKEIQMGRKAIKSFNHHLYV